MLVVQKNMLHHQDVLILNQCAEYYSQKYVKSQKKFILILKRNSLKVPYIQVKVTVYIYFLIILIMLFELR